MRKILQLISSDNLSVSVPVSWDKLSFKQFRYICQLFVQPIPAFSFDSILFLKLADISVLGNCDNGKVLVSHNKKFYIVDKNLFAVAPDFIGWVHQVADLFQLSFVLRKVHKSAVDLNLQSFSFADFLSSDSFFSGYVETNNQELGDRLVKKLFPKIRRVKAWHRSAAVIWFSAVKKYIISRFPELYGEQDKSDLFSSVNMSPAALREQIDSMIRALSKGDITIEEKVLAAPMYRALTELNQLAKEYRELKLN